MLVNVGFSYCIRDNQQKTFVMLSRLFLLSKNLESSLLLKDNNKLDETPTKNTCPFYIAFQVLRVFLIKNYKIAPVQTDFPVKILSNLYTIYREFKI